MRKRTIVALTQCITDSEHSLEEILNDYAKKAKQRSRVLELIVQAINMGAALATIAALYLKKVKSTEHVHVATFSSTRVFDSHGAEFYEELLEKRIPLE